MEILIVGILIIIALIVNGRIDTKKFIKDNELAVNILKESDYDFLVRAKYGDKVTPEEMFRKRVKNSLLIFIIMLFILIAQINFLNIVLCVIVTVVMFKSYYLTLKSYYKKHLHEIDLLLPYYLKSLEILMQHYTVPVALGKSIKDAPAIFKDGLDILISKINAGDGSIDPYMEFAISYPVRDSMRMMRLLYRLGMGNQERKDEQLMTFSRTISSLQNKSRETKYKERLNKMESKTMLMLSVTGIGVLLLLMLTIIRMFNV
ncbi:MAG: hypothetical protein RSB41_00420 [Bacilli bacterium]